MAEVQNKIIKPDAKDNLKGTILNQEITKNSLTANQKKKLKLLLKTHSSNEGDYKDVEILQSLLKAIEIQTSYEINDSREDYFRLNAQEIGWLKRFPENLWVEYLIYRYKLRLYPKNRVLLDFPPYILIEPTSICNLRCVMCFQVDRSFTKKEHMGMMSWDIFTKIVDEAALNNCKAITLASRGEPTLHPKLPEMIEYISKKKILDLKINTNATKLDEKLCKAIIENNVSELVFSVDAGTKETYEKVRVLGKFEKVLSNIKNFNKIRKSSSNKSRCVTRISGVKVFEDQDIDQMVNFWKKYVDEVSIKPATPRWDSYNNESFFTTESCMQLWERLYVWYDGEINPCDFDYKSYLSMGNIKNSTLKEIWRSTQYENLRRKHLEKKRSKCFPCDRCPL